MRCSGYAASTRAMKRPLCRISYWNSGVGRSVTTKQLLQLRLHRALGHASERVAVMRRDRAVRRLRCGPACPCGATNASSLAIVVSFRCSARSSAISTVVGPTTAARPSSVCSTDAVGMPVDRPSMSSGVQLLRSRGRRGPSAVGASPTVQVISTWSVRPPGRSHSSGGGAVRRARPGPCAAQHVASTFALATTGRRRRSGRRPGYRTIQRPA